MLIDNNERSAKRDSWPEAVAGKPFPGHQMRQPRADGHCGAPVTPPAAK